MVVVWVQASLFDYMVTGLRRGFLVLQRAIVPQSRMYVFWDCSRARHHANVPVAISSLAAGEQAVLSTTPLTGLWSYSNVTGAISVTLSCGSPSYSLNIGPSKINLYKRQTSSFDVIAPL